MATAPRCTWPQGCRNRTTHPTGRCRHHRTDALVATAHPGASVGPSVVASDPLADDPLAAGDTSDAWPAVTDDASRAWAPETTGRIPAADRHVTYRPVLLPTISERTPHLSPETVQLVVDATVALARSDDRNSGRSIVALLRSESAASSKIEHINVKQRYVARALAGLPTKKRSANEVAANLHALERALSCAEHPVTVDSINDIHRTLLPEEDWSGKLRTAQNWIGGSDYSPRGARLVPPAPEHVHRLVGDLATFINRTDMPALAQAAIAHAQFETIHPYPDGNGRVGRTLTHIVLRHRGVTPTTTAPLSIAILADPDGYLESLGAYEDGDVDGYVGGFARSAQIAAAAADKIASDVDSIIEEWQAIPTVAASRPDAVVHKIIPDLAPRPVTTAALTAERHGVSVQAARTGLDLLASEGVLNTTTAARGVQIYEAFEIFAAVEDLEHDVRAGNIVT